jgi:hypothetical protein
VVPVLSASRVSVTTSATLLATGTDNQDSVAIKNPGSNTAPVFISGSSSVTTGTGFEIAAGETLVLDIDSGETVYGIVTAIPQTVHVLRN